MKCINKECKNRCVYYIDENKVPIGTTVLDVKGNGKVCPVRARKISENKKHL